MTSWVVPFKRKIERVTLDGLQLLRSSIVGYTNDWNLEQT